MVWSIGDYNDFLTVVQDAFGLSREDAAEVYVDLRDVLEVGPLTVADLEEYADVASDLVFYGEPFDAIVEPVVFDVEPEADWELDMLDVGDELEITAEVHYE